MISNDPYEIFELTVEDVALNGLTIPDRVSEYTEWNISSLIQGYYDEGCTPFEAAIQLMRVIAIGIWDFNACSDYASLSSDGAINDLLIDIAGDKYADSESSDDPIYTTVQKLDYSELRSFITKGINIANTLSL